MKFLLCAFLLAGCQTTGKFYKLHHLAKEHKSFCYFVKNPKKIRGAYCIQYVGKAAFTLIPLSQMKELK